MCVCLFLSLYLYACPSRGFCACVFVLVIRAGARTLRRCGWDSHAVRSQANSASTRKGRMPLASLCDTQAGQILLACEFLVELCDLLLVRSENRRLPQIDRVPAHRGKNTKLGRPRGTSSLISPSQRARCFRRRRLLGRWWSTARAGRSPSRASAKGRRLTSPSSAPTKSRSGSGTSGGWPNSSEGPPLCSPGGLAQAGTVRARRRG